MSQLVSNQKKDVEDDIDLFMKSIALTVKKLPPQMIPQAKLEILTLVTNLQASSHHQQSYSTAATTPLSAPLSVATDSSATPDALFNTPNNNTEPYTLRCLGNFQ